MELIQLARDTAAAADRNPDALEITTSVPEDLDEIPRLAELGVDRILVPVTPTPGMGATVGSPEEAIAWGEMIERYAEL